MVTFASSAAREPAPPSLSPREPRLAIRDESDWHGEVALVWVFLWVRNRIAFVAGIVLYHLVALPLLFVLWRCLADDWFLVEYLAECLTAAWYVGSLYFVGSHPWVVSLQKRWAQEERDACDQRYALAGMLWCHRDDLRSGAGG